MMINNTNNEDLAGRSTYFGDIRYFSIIVFMATLVTAAIMNTQAEMKQIADLLAFLGLGYLIVGISVRLIRMRK